MGIKRHQIGIVVGSSLIVAALTSANRLISLNYKELFDVYTVFFTNFSLSLTAWLAIFFSEDILGTKRLKLGWKLTCNILASMIILLFVLFLIYNLSNTFDFYFTGKGNAMSRIIPASIFRTLILITAIQTVKYILDVSTEKQKVELENEILKREKLNAQFQSLKQQVNPHFLFNSLNTLKSLIRTSDSNGEEFVVRLSEIYRYILQKNQNDLVTVGEEMNILNAYIFMLKTRFEESIQVTIDIDNEVSGKKMLPPFTLQLLMENAIKHNVASVSRPLKIEISGHGAFLTVKNNLQPKRNTEESTGIGLDNIHKRCMFLYGAGLNVVKTDSSFMVEIPLKG